jgi:hypothetical protein
MHKILNDSLDISYIDFARNLPFTQDSEYLYLHVVLNNNPYKDLTDIVTAMMRMKALNIMNMNNQKFSIPYFEIRHNEGFFEKWVNSNELAYEIIVSTQTSPMFNPTELLLCKNFDLDFNSIKIEHANSNSAKRFNTFEWYRSIHYNEKHDEFMNTVYGIDSDDYVTYEFPPTIPNIIAAKYFEFVYRSMMFVTRNSIHILPDYETNILESISMNRIDVSDIMNDRANLIFYILSMRVYEIVEGHYGLVDTLINLLHEGSTIRLNLVMDSLLDSYTYVPCTYTNDLFIFDNPFGHFIFVSDLSFPSDTKSRLIRDQLKRSGVLYLADTYVYKNRSILYGIII